MIAYATITHGKRNLDAMWKHGWRFILQPTSSTSLHHSDFTKWRYALDNGAWSAHKKGKALDEVAFAVALNTLGARADFVVCPDIVAGGAASLEMSLCWLPRVAGHTKVALLAVQDGLEPQDVQSFLGSEVGLFVGGSTPWKLGTVEQWGALAREKGCWLHVGRVNTARRIHLVAHAGATSFDGTSPSRFAVSTPPLSRARDQLALFGRR